MQNFRKNKSNYDEICIVCLSKIKDPVHPDNCHHLFCKIYFILYTQSFDHCPYVKLNFQQLLIYIPLKSLINIRIIRFLMIYPMKGYIDYP